MDKKVNTLVNKIVVPNTSFFRRFFGFSLRPIVKRRRLIPISDRNSISTGVWKEKKLQTYPAKRNPTKLGRFKYVKNNPQSTAIKKSKIKSIVKIWSQMLNILLISLNVRGLFIIFIIICFATIPAHWDGKLG